MSEQIFTTAERLAVYRETLAWYKNSPSSIFLCPALLKTALHSENKTIEKKAENCFFETGTNAGTFCLAHFPEVAAHKPKGVAPGDAWFNYLTSSNGREVRIKVLTDAIEKTETLLHSEQNNRLSESVFKQVANFLNKLKREAPGVNRGQQ